MILVSYTRFAGGMYSNCAIIDVTSMSISFLFPILICAFAVLVHMLRLFLLLYNRFRISFLEDDITLYCDSVKERHAGKNPQEELVSVLTHVSHAEFIMPLLHNIRKQNYKNIELLVAVSHASGEIRVV